MKKNLVRLSAVVPFTLFAGSALATCSSILESIASSPSSLSYYQTNHPECFGKASPSSSQQISSTSFQQIGAISSGLGSRLLGGSSGPIQTSALTSGMAAGGTNAWNVWGNVSDASASYKATTAALRRLDTRSDTTNVVLGADYTISPFLVAGVSLAVDNGSGRLNATTNQNTTGFAVAPYIGWQINKKLALDASVGVGDGRQTQSGGAKVYSDRSFYAANLTYVDWFGNWQLTGKLGYLSAEERFDNARVAGLVAAGTGSTARLDQGRVGVEASYWLGNGFAPYVGVTYTDDLSRTKQAGVPWDSSAYLLSAGINYFSLKNGITGGVSYTVESGRSHTENSVIAANIGVRF